MKNYTFLVTETNTFCQRINIIAENKRKAEKLLKKDLEDNPISERSNTLDSQELDIIQIKHDKN